MTTENILSAFAHVIVISQAIGLLPLTHLPLGRLPQSIKAVLTSCYVAVLMLFYCYIFVNSTHLSNDNDALNWLNSAIYRVKTLVTGAMFVVMVGVTPFRRTSFVMLLSELEKIDDEMRIMSIAIPYDRTKRLINLSFYGATMAALSYQCFEMYLKHHQCCDALGEVSRTFSLYVHLVTEFHFVAFTIMIGRRFRMLNDWLGYYYSPDGTVAKGFYWVSPKGVTSSHLEVVSRVHYGLFVLAKKAERMYAFRIVLIVLLCFVMMTLKTYHFFSSLYIHRSTHALISSFASVAFDTAQLWIIAYATSMASEQGYRTSEMLHRLERSQKYDLNHKIDVALFSLQIFHSRLNYMACGLFPLDFSLLQSIVGAVTTYLIIFVQFDVAAQTKVPSEINANATAITPY